MRPAFGATLALLLSIRATAERGLSRSTPADEANNVELLSTRTVREHSNSRDAHLRSNSAHGATSSNTNVLRGGRSLARVKTMSVAEMGIVHKTEYWGKIYVGSPAQVFTVVFDTGSGNLIIPASDCQSAACQNHKRYDPSASSTGQQVGKAGQSLKKFPDDTSEASVRFGTGKVHGHFYQDRLCLAPDSACMTANFIGSDMETDAPFQQCNFDGILGLGFKDLSMGAGFNMVDDITEQHALKSDQFSVYLTDSGSSEISFGGYKEERAASEVFWVPVTRQSYWQIGIDDLTFNGKMSGLCQDCQVAVDTGTSLLAGPSDVIQKLNSKLYVREDCSNFDTLPLLGFAIGDKVLNLKPDDYIDRDEKSCSLSLMALDVPPPKGPLFIFGDPFLRRFLTVYDRDGPDGGPRVGFAVAKHEGQSDKDVAETIQDLSADSAAASSSASAVPSSSTETKAARARPGKSDSSEDPTKALESESSTWSGMFKGFGGPEAAGSDASASKQASEPVAATEPAAAASSDAAVDAKLQANEHMVEKEAGDSMAKFDEEDELLKEPEWEKDVSAHLDKLSAHLAGRQAPYKSGSGATSSELQTRTEAQADRRLRKVRVATESKSKAAAGGLVTINLSRTKAHA